MQNCKTSAQTAAKTTFKSSFLFRPATLAAILMLAVVFFVGCEKANTPKEDTGFIVRDADSPLKIVEVDSCQYLLGEWGNATVLTHKGNCKFCAARQHYR